MLVKSVMNFKRDIALIENRYQVKLSQGMLADIGL